MFSEMKSFYIFLFFFFNNFDIFWVRVKYEKINSINIKKYQAYIL